MGKWETPNAQVSEKVRDRRRVASRRVGDCRECAVNCRQKRQNCGSLASHKQTEGKRGKETNCWTGNSHTVHGFAYLLITECASYIFRDLSNTTHLEPIMRQFESAHGLR